MNSIITDLDNGECVDGWEYGMGNTIHIKKWGGKREGAGRKTTGRKKRNLYVTDEEFEEVKKLIEKLRMEVDDNVSK